jgi:hypothetical protein
MPAYTDPTNVVSVHKPSKTISNLGGILTIAAGAISVLFAGFFYLQNINLQNQNNKLNQKIASNNQVIDSLKSVTSELTTYQTEAKDLHLIFDNQIRWENVLTSIENKMYKNMYLSSFQIDNTGKFSFNGVTPDYKNYAYVYASMYSPLVSDVIQNVVPTSLQKVSKTDQSGKALASEIDFGFTASIPTSVLLPKPTTK